MADARDVLETVKKVSETRIEMLKEGTTFHNDGKRAYYLREYEARLKEIEELIRRMNIRLVHSRRDGQGDNPTA